VRVPLAQVGVLIVALQHLAFFVLESFLWERPAGRKIFKTSAEQARATASLAFNLGVYNSFLAAGLLWGLSLQVAQGIGYVDLSLSVERFFLGCVVVAGMAGGWSVSRSILFVQAVPAGVVFLLLANF
jgi:putative membrane protein